MANLVGKTLGKYELAELIGKGGMAEVYKAHHAKLNRYVTIKVLHSYLADGEDFTARFEREARAVAALRHRHIVQIHDFDAEDDVHYMVMEFIDGGTLQARMTELSKTAAYMPVRQVLHTARQVAGALDYAHQMGIIHRDIKPSNILLDSSGNAYLADFGIARVISATQFTSTGALIGTPTYMSPEQAQGLDLTEASDIYSLGIVLYELLVGKAPFTADTPLAIIHKHITERPPGPRSLRPDLPPALEQVMFKALAKEAGDRYQRAVDLVRDLEETLTADVVAKLDGADSQSAPLKSADADALERAHLPTELMEQPTQEAMSVSDAEQPAEAKPATISKQTRPANQEEPAVEGSAAAVELKKRVPALLRKPLVLIWIGVVLVGLLVGIINGLPGNEGPCETVDECVVQATGLREAGDLQGAVAGLNAAISLVPSDQHPQFAGLWCDRADIERELGQNDEARKSYDQCGKWTENNPDLQMIRDRAGQGLDSLSGSSPQCLTVDECVVQATGLREAGDLHGAVDSFDSAISLVPSDQHPQFAGLWCDRADMERELGWKDDAIRSYTQCIDWSGGDPALQPLRDRANEGLNMLQ